MLRSSSLWLSIPRFLWRGKWFWGAWLLVFLLPWTRDEARLHFVGSKFSSDLYGQPWQKWWTGDAKKSASTGAMTPLERAVWSERRERGGYYGYGQGGDPTKTEAARLLKRFPRETWLRALALRQGLSYNSVNTQPGLAAWAKQSARLDPGNAFFPLMLAKIAGDSASPTRRSQRDGWLQLAAKCSRLDDGAWKMRALLMSAARKAGVPTWSERWQIWESAGGYDWAQTHQFEALSTQLSVASHAELFQARVASRSKRASRRAAAKRLERGVLARSRAMMRVALLWQSAPCGLDGWRLGAKWTREAWRVARVPNAQFLSPPTPTLAPFVAFARAQGDTPSVELSSRCAARVRLLSRFTSAPNNGRNTALFSEFEEIWAEAGNGSGFVVLAFGWMLLCWWWLIGALLWGARGAASPPKERLFPAIFAIGLTLGLCAGMMAVALSWIGNAAIARRGPPNGQLEVMAAGAIFAFFAPPLLLALWCAARTRRQHRQTLAVPARQQIEMALSPVDGFMLGRATGVFVGLFLALAVGLTLFWAWLRWNSLAGYDWLRAMLPDVSTRVVDPIFTSFDSFMVPLYSGLCLAALVLVWIAAWRYAVDAARRPVFHGGLRAWKETLGVALTLSVWVYLALMAGNHFAGERLERRLEVAATRGEGALVKGF